MLHAFLAWIEFDVNPVGWTYLFVAVPAFLVSVVRFIHYYPLVVATNDDALEQDLLSWCMGSLFWPIAVVLLVLYWGGVGFAWLVHVVWPIEVPKFVRPLSQEEVNDLLDSNA